MPRDHHCQRWSFLLYQAQVDTTFKHKWMNEWIMKYIWLLAHCVLNNEYRISCFCLIFPGLLSPTLPFPPQGPQGPMGFGQPRPPLLGYGGVFSDCAPFLDTRDVFIGETTNSFVSFKQVDLLTHPTSMEEAEATMTTSGDKVATWESHATSGETTVRVIFIILWSLYAAVGEAWTLWNYDHLFSFFMHPQSSQNVTRRSTQHHWISWSGCTRWYWLLLEGSLYPLSLHIFLVFLFWYWLAYFFSRLKFLFTVQQKQVPAVLIPW